MTFARGAAFVLVAYLALLATSSLSAMVPLHGVVPEAALLLVLYLGLGGRGSSPTLVAMALLVGYFVDLFSGSPRGLHALTFGLVMVLARGASSRLLVASVWQQVVVALLASVGHGAMLVALSSPMYDPEDAGAALQALRVLPATALSTALLAPFAFALFRRLDKRLAPDPRALRVG